MFKKERTKKNKQTNTGWNRHRCRVDAITREREREMERKKHRDTCDDGKNGPLANAELTQMIQINSEIVT